MVNSHDLSVAVLGEFLIDVKEDGSCVAGGAAANAAYRLKELGANCCLVSAIGSDSTGEKLSAYLESRGMTKRFVQTLIGVPSGTVDVRTGAGSNSYTIHPAAWDQILFTDEMAAYAGNLDAVIFSSLAQREYQSRRAIQQFVEAAALSRIFFDVNLRPPHYSKEILEWGLLHAEYVKVSEDEVGKLGEVLDIEADSLEWFAEMLMQLYDIEHVLFTLGDRGAVVYQASGETVYSPGRKVVIANTVGCGDSFLARFTLGALKGEPLRYSLDEANLIAAAVATQPGGMESISSELLASISGAETVIDERYK